MDMKVGDLVRSMHDHSHCGIIIETDPEYTRFTHPKGTCRVQWFDGEDTIEFFKILEVVSESR